MQDGSNRLPARSFRGEIEKGFAGDGTGRDEGIVRYFPEVPDPFRSPRTGFKGFGEEESTHAIEIPVPDPDLVNDPLCPGKVGEGLV